MKTTEKLFSDFESATRDQWKAKAIEDLKGADFEKKLVWKTDDGFSIQPFYTPEDVENTDFFGQHAQFANSQRSWINYVEIRAEDYAQANQLAKELKKFGANGFLFMLKNNPEVDFATLLEGLDLENDYVSFSSDRPFLSLIRNYFSYIEEKRLDLEKIKGFYEADILESWITKDIKPDFKELAEVLKLTTSTPGFKGLSIRSHAFVNAGATTTQELAFTLNKLTDYLDGLSQIGFNTSEAIGEITLHMAIGGDYFFEIAKLRSMRSLTKNILKLYGVNGFEIGILSSNSLWSKSLYDPQVNMLRNTTEAMSALLGGCNALLTLPHDSSYKDPTKFSQRIALNISNILKEESYFDKVIDPAGGSYYIENLTQQITDGSLALFKEIEEKGGFIKAFSEGAIQQKIKEVRDKKERELASRKRVYVGTNKYPNLQEKTDFSDFGENEILADHLLVPQRVTKSFEELRNRTLIYSEKTGFTPKVYLACFGNLAMRKARASFSSEFFGTAGFDVLGEFFFDSAEKAAEESAKSDADIIVMCSSDQDYENQAVNFAEKFRAISKDKSLVLAGYPESLIEVLKQAGVDTFIHMKSNAIEVLTSFQNKLFVK